MAVQQGELFLEARPVCGLDRDSRVVLYGVTADMEHLFRVAKAHLYTKLSQQAAVKGKHNEFC